MHLKKDSSIKNKDDPNKSFRKTLDHWQHVVSVKKHWAVEN